MPHPTPQQQLTDSIRVANGLPRKYTPQPTREPQAHVPATVGPNRCSSASFSSYIR